MQKENLVNLDSFRTVVNAVRTATKVVKIFPFIYALGLLILLPPESILDYALSQYLETLFYVSALFVMFLIRLSYCFRLCKWHRLQCSLPLLPQITDFIDSNVYEFSVSYAVVNNMLFGAILALSLVNAYYVFIKQEKIPIFSC